MSTHNFDDEGPLMRERRCIDVIDRLTDPSQRGVTANGSICVCEVVVNGPHQPNDVEVLKFLLLFGGDVAFAHELFQ